MKENPQTVQDIVKRLRSANADEFASLERALAADTRITIQDALVTARKRIALEQQEEERLNGLYRFDAAHSQGVILGLDEVGRGPLAGPLAVGGVVLPKSPHISYLNDSKQLSDTKRNVVAEEVKRQALAWTVVYIEPAEIDQQGITASLRKAFLTAIHTIEEQGITPDCILLDGLALHLDEREINVVKGDAQSASIAAASVLAKVSRDTLMSNLSSKYPEYDFDQNKGYGSVAHIAAIKEHGLCPLHRRSFCSGFLQETLF